MTRDRNENAGPNAVAGDLEPYRRLVDLQKQMIELAQQHEQSKRKRDALHEQVAQEVAARRNSRDGTRYRLQRSAARLLKRMSGFARRKPVPARPKTNNQSYAKSH